MKEISLTGKKRETEYLLTFQGKNTTVCESRIRNMVWVNILGQMEEDILVTGLRIKNKDLDYFKLQMVRSLKGIDLMDYNMVKEK